MAVKNYISPGALLPRPTTGSSSTRNYISPGAIQPNKAAAPVTNKSSTLPMMGIG